MTPDVILLTVMVISGITAFVAMPAAFPRGVIRIVDGKCARPAKVVRQADTQEKAPRVVERTAKVAQKQASDAVSFEKVQVLCNYYGGMHSVRPEALLWELCMQRGGVELHGLSVTGLHFTVSELASRIASKAERADADDRKGFDRKVSVSVRELCELCKYYGGLHSVAAEVVLWIFCAERGSMVAEFASEEECHFVISALAHKLSQNRDAS